MLENMGTDFRVQSGQEKTAQKGTTLSRESGDMGPLIASGRGIKRARESPEILRPAEGKR